MVEMVSLALISKILQISALIISVLTLITFTYGVVSWCLIRKFRSFRNHVLLNATVASLLRFLAVHVMSFVAVYFYKHTMIIAFINAVIIFFALVFHCWMVVLCYIFYVDYVKVFHLDINGEYIITNVFAWCLPFVQMSGIYITYALGNPDSFLKMSPIYFFLIPTILSAINYLAALYSVFFGRKTEVWTSEQKLGHFALSTLIFVVNNSFVAVQICKEFFEGDSLIYFIVGVATEYCITLFVYVYFICVKSNRALWGQYLSKTPVEQSSKATA